MVEFQRMSVRRGRRGQTDFEAHIHLWGVGDGGLSMGEADSDFEQISLTTLRRQTSTEV